MEHFIYHNHDLANDILQEITSQAVLAGVGGVHDAQFPWSTWKKTGWFEAAVTVVSLSIRHLDRLIPGYRNFEQSLQSEYIGKEP